MCGKGKASWMPFWAVLELVELENLLERKNGSDSQRHYVPVLLAVGQEHWK